MSEADKQPNKNFDWLKAYSWKKGQSGNPAGRPKEKTLKEFAREMLANMSDEDRVEYLKTLPSEIIWKMSEGMPHQTQDSKLDANLTVEVINFNENKDTTPIST